ncbi:MAG: hypothetical protein EXR61_00460 [Chloroflexi bacterium]|nr:hypothetical protein [Chloroflexota bacterium]
MNGAFRRLLTGSATVPRARWTATSRWRPEALTLVMLVTGLSMFGLGQAMQVQAGLGNDSWTVLAQGITVRTGLDLGLSTLAVGIGVLLLWVPLRERPGLGTLLNIVVIAVALSFGVRVIPPQSDPPFQFVMSLAGIVLVGLGSGLYLTCGLGPGPRDGWMTAAHDRTGWPIARVRLLIEVIVLSVGWLLGGDVGIGTILFALLIGRSVAYGLALVAAFAPARS